MNQSMPPTRLNSPAFYGIGRTPLLHAKRFLPQCRLMVKLEGYNLFGSIKARTAYYLLRDLSDRGLLLPGTQLVESSSGNLGLAVAGLVKILGGRFQCLIDPPPLIPEEKLQQLIAANVNFVIPPLDGFTDRRSARIAWARRLGSEPGTIWLNQYDNPANVTAHECFTGPELMEQLGRAPDYLVCCVGTGGTICGIASYLASIGASTCIVAVEPEGSTIFGGPAGCYLSAGGGLKEPSGILRRHWPLLDKYVKVTDQMMIAACLRFQEAEGEAVGITTGACLVAAERIALEVPGTTISVIAPDGAGFYDSLFEGLRHSPPRPTLPPPLRPVPQLHLVDSTNHADPDR